MTNTRAIKWLTSLQDAGDGSGDSILELPHDLMHQLGWNVGDELTLERLKDDTLILRRSAAGGN